MSKGVDWGRFRFGALAAALAASIAYAAQPLIHGNDDAIGVIVNTFSILAGFLVAIIAIVGDPALLPSGTWRAAELNRGQMVRRLIRYKWLFVSYLATLALVFISLLVKDELPSLTVWIERAFLFFGTASFVFSLHLPSALIAAQQDKIDAIIEQRRRNDGIPEQREGAKGAPRG